jgi:hypothetical protein
MVSPFATLAVGQHLPPPACGDKTGWSWLIGRSANPFSRLQAARQPPRNRPARIARPR